MIRGGVGGVGVGVERVADPVKLWPVVVWPLIAEVEGVFVVPLLTLEVEPVLPWVEPVVPLREPVPVVLPVVEPVVEPVVLPEVEPVVEPVGPPDVEPVVPPGVDPLVPPEVPPPVPPVPPDPPEVPEPPVPPPEEDDELPEPEEDDDPVPAPELADGAGAGGAEVKTACCTATAISRETFVTACRVDEETACVEVGSEGSAVTTTCPAGDCVTETVMTISWPWGTESPLTMPDAVTEGAGVGTPPPPVPPPDVEVVPPDPAAG